MIEIQTQKYAFKLSAIFALLTAVICGAFIFSKGLDSETLIYSFSVILPASFSLGALGFLIGKIFDSVKKKESSSQTFK